MRMLFDWQTRRGLKVERDLRARFLYDRFSDDARRSPSTSQPAPARAFTLLEVVVAIGVFAVGMIAVIGFLVPIARSTAGAADAEAAANLAPALNDYVQRRAIEAQSFSSVTKLLKAAT